jgi:hypothetical protein
MNTHQKLIFLLIIALIVASGCSDDPSELGAGLVSPTDTVSVRHYLTAATSDTTFLYRIGGTSNTLVGIYESIETRALLQFPSLSSIPDTAILDSAVLKIPINYTFKDSSGHITADIHSLLRAWTSGTFTWDSVFVSGFYSGTTDAILDHSLNPGDTALFISMESLIKNWMEDGTDSSRGIIIIPKNSMTTAIAGGVNVGPVLKISYRENSGDTTHTLYYNPTMQTTVANGNLSTSELYTYIQAGVGFRSLIRFDSLSLPRSVSITEAILELTLDKSASLFNGKSRDTITAHLLRANTFPYDTIALSTICSPNESNGKKIYQGNIKAIVQQWVIGTPNYGIVLRPLGEYTTYDLFGIYGSTSDSLKPKLKITYTVLP